MQCKSSLLENVFKMLVLFEHLISECTQQGERDDLFKNHYGVSNEFQEEIWRVLFMSAKCEIWDAKLHYW